MTERERWIVYPLLVLALGASLRDKFVKPAAPTQIDAARVLCEELRAQRVVVIDPKQKQPRIVLDTTPEPRSQGAAPALGQIELLGGSKQLSTTIARGKVQCETLACRQLGVADLFGQVRVAIGTRTEGPADGQTSRLATSGVVEVFGHNNFPAVQLLSDAEGGVVVARHENRPFAVVTGNLPHASGVFVQHGRDQIATTPLAPPILKREIEKLPKLEVPTAGPNKPGANGVKTPPAVQPTAAVAPTGR